MSASSSDRVPKALEAKFKSVSALTDSFCAEHLDEE